MQLVVAVVGMIVEAITWRGVSARRLDLWRVMPVVLGAMAVAAVLVRPPTLVGSVGTSTATLVGVAAGITLFAATRAFVAVAARWPPFRRATRAIYGQARPVPVAFALGVSAFVMVPFEELFWRGLVQARLADGLGAGMSAALTWAAYVAVNVASRSLPIVLGAAVGGALWAGLAWWSGGMLASLLSHILWTGLMLGLPPKPGREMLQT